MDEPMLSSCGHFLFAQGNANHQFGVSREFSSKPDWLRDTVGFLPSSGPTTGVTKGTVGEKLVVNFLH